MFFLDRAKTLFSKAKTKLEQPRKKFFWELLVIFSLGLVPLIWFEAGQIIDGGDINLAVNAPDFTYRLLHLWDIREVAGHDLSQQISLLFPYSLFFTAFHYLGFSLIVTEKIYFILAFTLGGFSIYYLIYSLTRNRVASFIAAVFFMFNIPRVDRLFAGDFHMILMYGILPLTIAFFIKGLKSKKVKIRYALLIALTVLFFNNWNPATTIAVIPFFIIYFLIHTGLTRFKLLFANTKFILLMITAIILFNLWWIYPMAQYLLGEGATTGLTSSIHVSDVGHWLDSFSQQTSLLALFRLSGEWYWNSIFLGEEQALYSPPYFLNPGLVITTYIIPLFAFGLILFKPKDKFVLFFSISALVYVLLGAGPNSPAGEVYRWFYENVPGFVILRSPYQRFSLMIVLCYSFMIGVFGSRIYKYFKDKRRLWTVRNLHLEKLSIAIILAVVLISAWPLFTTHISHSKSQVMPPYTISIPEYYGEAESWLEDTQDSDSRLLVLPEAGPWLRYEWEYSGPSDILNHLFTTPQISNVDAVYSLALPRTQDMISELYDALFLENSFSYNIMGLLNIDRIVVRNDLSNPYDQPRSSEKSTKELDKLSPAITFDRSFGELDFYELDDQYFVPHIYATNDFQYVSGNIEALISLVSNPVFDLQSAILFSDIVSMPGRSAVEQLADVMIYDVMIYNNEAKPNTSYNIDIPKSGNYEVLVARGPDLDLTYAIDAPPPEPRGRIVVSANSVYGPDFEPYRATDRDMGTRWASVSMSPPDPTIWQVDLGDTRHVGMIFIRQEEGPDARIQGGYELKSSADGMTWTTRFKDEGSGDTPQDIVLYLDFNDRFLQLSTAPDKYGTTFNEFEVYSAGLSNPMPELYLQKLGESYLSKGNHSITFLGAKGDFPDQPDYFILRWQSISATRENDSVDISFIKINPTKYKVLVNNATDPYALVFSESFNPGWKAYVSPGVRGDGLGESSPIWETWFKESLPEDKHFLVNGYANAWLIDESGDHEIILEYEPQKLYRLGLVISGMALLGCISYLIWHWRHRRKEASYLPNSEMPL